MTTTVASSRRVGPDAGAGGRHRLLAVGLLASLADDAAVAVVGHEPNVTLLAPAITVNERSREVALSASIVPENSTARLVAPTVLIATFAAKIRPPPKVTGVEAVPSVTLTAAFPVGELNTIC